MPAGILLEFGKGKPPKDGDDKSAPMGGDDKPDEGNEFDAALDDAFEAVTKGDKAGFRDALGAAISAKCAEMYSDEDSGEER